MQGANGTYRQIIQFMRVGNDWKQAYAVETVAVNGALNLIGQLFDEGFPPHGEVVLQHRAGVRQLP